MERFTVTHKHMPPITSSPLPLVNAIAIAKKVKDDTLVYIPTDEGMYHVLGRDVLSITATYAGPLDYVEALYCMQIDSSAEYFSDFGHVFRYQDGHTERRIGNQWIPATLPAEETFTRLSKTLYASE